MVSVYFLLTDDRLSLFYNDLVLLALDRTVLLTAALPLFYFFLEDCFFLIRAAAAPLFPADLSTASHIFLLIVIPTIALLSGCCSSRLTAAS